MEFNPEFSECRDDENRLRSTSGTGIAASTLKYDPLGRLYETTIAGVVTRFLYDGDALVAEYNSAGTLTRRYVHGDQVDEPWVQYSSAATGSANWRYLHADHQGSIIAHSSVNGAQLAVTAVIFKANKKIPAGLHWRGFYFNATNIF